MITRTGFEGVLARQLEEGCRCWAAEVRTQTGLVVRAKVLRFGESGWDSITALADYIVKLGAEVRSLGQKVTVKPVRAATDRRVAICELCKDRPGSMRVSEQWVCAKCVPPKPVDMSGVDLCARCRERPGVRIVDHWWLCAVC